VSATLHPSVRPISFLLGTWVGEGTGAWPPDAEPFAYGEELTFEDVGDEFLQYSQRSWTSSDGSPLHFERGFLRPGGAGHLELVLAHPLGVVELAEGSVAHGVIDVASTHVAATRTGSPVTALRRRIEVRDDVLRYELWMATRDVPLRRHLRAELKRA
jgi:hypothetical protein